MASFNYTAIRNTALKLVATFGQPSPIVLLRNVNVTPDDATKPWRGSAATIKQFPFIGVANTLGFGRRGAYGDAEKIIIIPGTLATTAAVGDPDTLCGDPTLTDHLLVGAVEYQILGLQDITPGSDAIIYKAYVKAWPTLIEQPPSAF